jgi:hypothetical protein
MGHYFILQHTSRSKDGEYNFGSLSHGNLAILLLV